MASLVDSCPAPLPETPIIDCGIIEYSGAPTLFDWADSAEFEGPEGAIELNEVGAEFIDTGACDTPDAG
jgi:hypothetical protein